MEAIKFYGSKVIHHTYLEDAYETVGRSKHGGSVLLPDHLIMKVIVI